MLTEQNIHICVHAACAVCIHIHAQRHTET